MARMTITYGRSWLVGAAGYVVGLVVTGFALSSLVSAQGPQSVPRWAWLMIVAPPLVGALVAVLALRLPVRPPWYAGGTAVLGCVAVAVAAGVLTLVESAAYVQTPPYGALGFPVLVTALPGLGLGLLRRHTWAPPEAPDAGYSGTSATEVPA